MKFAFTPSELQWLHKHVNSVLSVASLQGMDDLVRLSARMRYKFTPNAAFCWLNGKERVALLSLIEFRLKQYGEISLSDEFEMLTKLRKKVAEGTEATA